VNKTSSDTRLTLIPVRSKIATRVCLMSGWIVAGLSHYHLISQKGIHNSSITFIPFANGHRPLV
jgi:hypothetical protein